MENFPANLRRKVSTPVTGLDWNWVLKTMACNRVHMFLWLCQHNRLPTKSLLHRRQILVTDLCHRSVPWLCGNCGICTHEMSSCCGSLGKKTRFLYGTSRFQLLDFPCLVEEGLWHEVLFSQNQHTLGNSFPICLLDSMECPKSIHLWNIKTKSVDVVKQAVANVIDLYHLGHT